MRLQSFDYRYRNTGTISVILDIITFHSHALHAYCNCLLQQKNIRSWFIPIRNCFVQKSFDDCTILIRSHFISPVVSYMADRISVRLTGIRILFGMETACRKGPHICTYIAMERSVRWTMLSTSRRRTWSEFTCVLPAKRVVRIIKVRYHIASTVIMPFAVPMQNFISDKMCFAAAPEHPPHISTSSRAAYLLNAALHRKTLIFNRTAVLSIHYIFFSHTQPLWHRHRSNKFAATVMYGDGGFFFFFEYMRNICSYGLTTFRLPSFFFSFLLFLPVRADRRNETIDKSNQKRSKPEAK